MKTKAASGRLIIPANSSALSLPPTKVMNHDFRGINGAGTSSIPLPLALKYAPYIPTRCRCPSIAEALSFQPQQHQFPLSPDSALCNGETQQIHTLIPAKVRNDNASYRWSLFRIGTDILGLSGHLKRLHRCMTTTGQCTPS